MNKPNTILQLNNKVKDLQDRNPTVQEITIFLEPQQSKLNLILMMIEIVLQQHTHNLHTTKSFKVQRMGKKVD